MSDPQTTDPKDLPGYLAGFNAHGVGEHVQNNPYSWRQPERQNWHAGWMEARAQWEQEQMDASCGR